MSPFLRESFVPWGSASNYAKRRMFYRIIIDNVSLICWQNGDTGLLIITNHCEFHCARSTGKKKHGKKKSVLTEDTEEVGRCH